MRPLPFFFLAILLVLAGLSNAYTQSTTYYEKEWMKVDDLIQKKNLPRSALEEVKKIYSRAKVEKQDAQVIKALVYMAGLQQENRENNELLIIKELEKEISINKEPASSILQSMLADLYWQYFQRNRWKLYARTQVTGFNQTDIATWASEDFHRKITQLYLLSIRNVPVLKNTNLTHFETIITKGNVRHLRPTLYDLLAHRALEYFKNNERDIKKPAYAFNMNRPEAFAQAADFVKAKFTTADSLSLQHKALLIYQDLIATHLEDALPAALIDVDIERISFVYQHAVMENKDELYVAALNHIIRKYAKNPEAATASYLLALHYEQLAAQYDPLKDTAYHLSRIKARDILLEVVKDSSIKNEGWTNSYNLLAEINRPNFSFEVEKVNVPNQAFRALVKFRNLTQLHFRLIRADRQVKEQMRNRYDEKYWSLLLAQTPIKTWSQALPAAPDLMQHSVEIKVDGLPVGEYILVASARNDFNRGQAPLGAQLFYVSSISYIHQGSQFFVLHRESGQPLTGAAVQVYQQQYDYKNYRYSRVKMASYRTDKNGYFQINRIRDDRDLPYYLDIAYDGDSLNLDELIYNYHNYDTDINTRQDAPKRIFFFTDRSIYRPGQAISFKGIVVAKNGDSNRIEQNFRARVFLRDANYQNVDSVELTTNEFGSFAGKFQLPAQHLNGTFTIEAAGSEGQVLISVEEYKRPKFYVEFDKIQESYRVGDSITMKGTAKAYAGNLLDNAAVAYRVVRQPRLVYPWHFRGGWLPPTPPMEIAHGTVSTDSIGRFKITFRAIPDAKIDPKVDPVFDYRISADVTDVNGETRTGGTLVSAGYKSILLKVDVAEKLATDSFKTISIRTENMNGEYQPSTIVLTLSKLIPEQRLIRKRYWQQPDLFVMEKAAFISNFPHDEYMNETDFKTWEKGETVYSKTDSTMRNGQWVIDAKELQAGFYQLEIATSDKDGHPVKDIRFIELFDQDKNQLARPEYLWTKANNAAVEPGESTGIQIGSSASQVFMVQQIDYAKEQDKLLFIPLNDEKKTLRFTARESDRGGFGVSFFFVKHNRVYLFNEIIQVPWSNKDLQIEYATFRDKTTPGNEEKWKVRVSGYKNESVAAEMLASMYDASLDQFKPHQWEKAGLWPVYARVFHWSGAQNFSAIESQQKWLADGNYRQFQKRYDQFIFDRASTAFNLETRRLRVQSMPTAPPENKRQFSQEGAMDSSASGITRGAATGAQANAQKIENFEEAIQATGKPALPGIQNPQETQIRKNFNETAFFFPDLRTDKDGNLEFSFTAPEALTRWKLQTVAHTKGLAFGTARQDLVTQKELMVQPNAPRFLRQGDRMEFSVKVVNLSNQELTGQVQLELIDATTNQSVDGWFQNIFPNQYFTVAAGQSEAVKFPLEVPFLFNKALGWRVTARSGNFSDGEESSLPVLTNKLLVTETLPLPMRGATTKNFTFEKLLKANSETLQHHALTVEYTANPAWYAVQALPYLMDHPHESAEQSWNRYYANALGTMMVNASPRIRQIFERWKSADTAALLSNLHKNEELKSALLQETPWVMQAKTETEQKRNIALLMDLAHMHQALKGNLEQLRSMQSENGGFVWFKGGPDDRYFTQYIVSGIGHLKKLNAIPKEQRSELDAVAQNALAYLDNKLKADYESLVKSKADLKKQHPHPNQIQYLYLRSFFPETPVAANLQTAYQYYRKQAQQNWMKQNKQVQAMTALALYRTGDVQTAKAILASLRETAINSEEMGMYWKDNAFGFSWYWWSAPIETQALIIEAFTEIEKDRKTTDELKTWIIKNKQTTNWRTSKATAEACYSLLLQGTDWLAQERVVNIQLGPTTVSSSGSQDEAGTGYWKKSVEGAFVQPEMGQIAVTVQQTGNATAAPSWGAVYWQYFEEMDKVTMAATPLALNKQLFVEKNTDRGPGSTAVKDGDALKVGDKLKVRIELKVDRDMEYVHMKDLRASGLEPVNVLSGYKWQGGLGYYEATKDASTNFFFGYLRKGTYVFEYPVFVTHAGSFSNGITSIQSMYAPEFSAHSNGVRITVE